MYREGRGEMKRLTRSAKQKQVAIKRRLSNERRTLGLAVWLAGWLGGGRDGRGYWYVTR